MSTEKPDKDDLAATYRSTVVLTLHHAFFEKFFGESPKEYPHLVEFTTTHGGHTGS